MKFFFGLFEIRDLSILKNKFTIILIILLSVFLLLPTNHTGWTPLIVYYIVFFLCLTKILLILLYMFLIIDKSFLYTILLVIIILLNYYFICYYNNVFIFKYIDSVVLYQFFSFSLGNFTLLITWIFHSTSLYFLAIILISCIYSIFRKTL